MPPYLLIKKKTKVVICLSHQHKLLSSKPQTLHAVKWFELQSLTMSFGDIDWHAMQNN